MRHSGTPPLRFWALALGLAACSGTPKTTQHPATLAPATAEELALLDEGSVDELAAAESDGVKRALIVAIGDYDETTGWRDINAGNDLPLIQGALLRQGFPPENIGVLRDAAATRQAIEDTFQAHLVDGANPGDVLVFHYSGHGQQITDDDGDEAFDGYDEALVAVDAHAAPSEAYSGEAHLRDDDFGALLDAARTRIGPEGHMLVLLDSCYSGSSSRGVSEAVSRSASGAFGPPGARSTDAVFENGGGVFTPRQSAPEGVVEPDDAMGSLVIISASRHDQKNHETTLEDGTPVGSLSLAFSTTLEAMSSDEMSYRELFTRIDAEMRGHVPNQQPQVEGDIDTRVLNGRAVPQQPYVRVKALRPDKARLSSGQFGGVFEGARVELHPVGTTDPTKSQVIAAGTVAKARNFTSVVRFDAPIEGTPPGADDVWAFVTAPGFPPMRLSALLVTESSPDCPTCALAPGLVSSLQKGLADSPVFELSTGPMPTASSEAELVLFASPEGTAFLHLPTQQELKVAPPDADLTRELLGYQRARYLVDLNASSGTLRVNAELRRAHVTFDALGTCTTFDVLGKDEVIRGIAPQPGYRIGEGFAVEVKNTGEEPAHIAVLYLTPRGEIAQIFPDDPRSEDNIVQPGDAVLVGPDACWITGEPAGTDFIKVFASREPMDFTGILTENENRSAATMSLTEQLVSNVFKHRGPPRNTGKRHESVAIETLAIEIRE